MTDGSSRLVPPESSLQTSVDEIAFLVGSAHRVRILGALYDRDACSRDELRELVDASRTTVQRNVQALEERGWITNSSVEYDITPVGALVTEELLGLVETMQLATDLRKALRWLPREELGFDLRELRDAAVTVASPTSPYAPVDQLVTALETATRFRGLFATASLATVEVLQSRAGVADTHWCVILTADGREALSSDYAERFASLRAADALDLHAYPGDVPFYLGLLDDEVQLGFTDGDGVLKALVQSTSPTVREWADDTFEAYYDESAPVE